MQKRSLKGARAGALGRGARSFLCSPPFPSDADKGWAVLDLRAVFLSRPLRRRSLAPASVAFGRAEFCASSWGPFAGAWLPPGTPSLPKNGGSLAFSRMLALKGKRGIQAGCEAGSAGSQIFCLESRESQTSTAEGFHAVSICYKIAF